ncbi:von Willebrand factor A domain-containing protein 5A isoform X2 [Cucumis melo var. makuwa]|uniref:von Willebrand factor A domain-containing protein 5A isoform X2 n=1 Tax=Cucumis melo var. makuwa TaxID=1194695 RepID=A0A5A7UW49_CUCMM|nr:von Willebrand factor A domain-containing protein 5A isoform X2 [Cucumis melo var. makuwa]
MATEFSNSVEYGLHLSKRIYYGKGSAPAALARQMSRVSEDYLPRAPMVYAVIPEPTIVDNPDVPSYQPYVHGRCVPPALIPLHMNGVSMEINCCFDTAFIGVNGTWRVHCVMAGKSCECLIAVPMGEQGSLLGVEVDVTGTFHRTELVSMEDAEAIEKLAKSEDGKFLKGRRIYTLKIPKVEGGCTLSVRINWSQRIPYVDDLFCLSVPFSFPAYLVPPGKKSKNSQKILLHINSGISSEVVCKHTSHPMKILRREVGNVSFSNEAEVSAWSNMDFDLSYSISPNDLFGGVLLQTPSLHDFDQREMFCLYIFPGQNHNRQVFRKEVVFIIDISGSMKDGPLESTKRAVLASLSKLNPEDAFNIIGFNGDTKLFSLSMEQATKEAITRATDWINANLVANGGTNILLPVEQAIKMLAETGNSIPLIFLITDGSVDNEREICNIVKASLKSRNTISPRLCTFGIGTFCNHYFLQMLSEIGRGIYDAAYDVDLIDSRFQTLFTKASSVFLANITVDAFKHLDSFELFPTQIPDLACGSPLIISGRYNGCFPESFKVSGTSADMSNSTIHLQPQRAKELLLDRVLARRQIDIMTSHAWLLESKDLQDKIAKLSKQSGFPSEYTRLILVLAKEGKKAPPSIISQEMRKRFDLTKSNKVEWKGQKIILLGNQGVGFGNLTATAENLQPGKEIKATQATDLLVKAATNCCSRLIDRFCCLCFIKSCMYMNDRCVVAFTQLTAALACCEIFNCCFELCECDCF